MKDPRSPDALLARLGSLADPTRLRLLALLAGHELGVGELAGIVQLPQSSVSRHLKLLAEHGWVVSRPERTANLYSMADGELPESSRELWALTRTEMAGWAALTHDRLRLERRLAERAAASNSFFAGVAERWEELRAELYGQRFTEAAIAALLPRDWVVADLACGAGDVAVRLAPSVRRVVAVDASPEMLQTARRRARGLANVELFEGDLAALPIPDATCDAALLILALTHVEEPPRAAAELVRILKPGGRAVIVDLLRHDRDEFRREMGQLRNGFEADELTRLLADAGLAEVDCSPLPPAAAAKGPALLLATGSRPESGRVTSRVARRQPARVRR